MVFADSAARTTALSGVLAEGMMSYLQDTDSVEVYDGSAWTAVGGGGSSPLTTKGDLYTFSTVDARLGVGANGTVLTADSAETTGLKWAAAAGGGKILQVISAELDTQAISSTSTYADTGLTATITPTSATSTILVISNCAIGKDTGNTGVSLRLLRGATTIKEFAKRSASDGGSGENFVGTFSHSYIDSPATTSVTTYKVQFASYNNTARVYVSSDFGGVKEKSTILLMEIGA